MSQDSDSFVPSSQRSPVLGSIPDELQQVSRWLLWRYDEHEKKQPHSAKNLYKCDPNDPANWSTFAEAMSAFLRNGSRFDGVGFALGDDFAGVDLDDCRDPVSGVIEPWADHIIKFMDSYSEISPSQTGVKIFLRGRLSMEKPRQDKVRTERGPGAELYDRKRYFTVTGLSLKETPATIETRTTQVEELYGYMYSKDLVIRMMLFDYVLEKSENRIDIKCPWAEDHSTSDQPRDASVFLTDGKSTGFKCLHASHEDKTIVDVLRFFGLLKKSKRGDDDTFTDDDLALAFTEEHKEDMLYVHLWGRWLRWDDTRWREENTLAVYDLARGLMRRLGIGRDARTINAVVGLARSDRAHARLPEDFDRDPTLLNTPAGSVDLRTGELRPHSRNDLVTKVTPVSPDGDCPLWRECLRTWTGENQELENFLQRLVGYCLTGSVKEEVLPVLFGLGANGKTKFVEAVRFILGSDYMQGIAMETLIVTYGEQHPTDIASLRGARLAVAEETEEGRRLAEAKVKQLTGGGRLRARFMRQDFFEFDPTHKLWIVGNHKPQLTNLDPAIRRRILLVPFEVTIPTEKRDRDLGEKLKKEAGGILRWAIEGAVAWYQNGLEPPELVGAASREYFAAQDVISDWMEERLLFREKEDGHSDEWIVAKADLFKDWKLWALSRGERERKCRWLCEQIRQRRPELKDDVRGKKGEKAFGGLKLRYVDMEKQVQRILEKIRSIPRPLFIAVNDQRGIDHIKPSDTWLAQGELPWN